jgi:hypothetical protein
MNTDDFLEAAERAEAACDLEAGLPGGAARLAEVVTEVCASGDLSRASVRALWNVLWVAGDLTRHVDVYRASRLLGSVVHLFERHVAGAVREGDDAAAPAEMAFDFFFNHPPGEQPLATARVGEAVAALERVLALDNPVCKRAALHGLSHLRRVVDRPEPVDGLFDAFLRTTTDATLAGYAARARSGELD